MKNGKLRMTALALALVMLLATGMARAEGGSVADVFCCCAGGIGSSASCIC